MCDVCEQVMIWNLDCLEQVIKNPVRTISHHTDVVLSMSFGTDGSLFATTCRDRKIRLIESRSGNLLQVSARGSRVHVPSQTQIIQALGELNSRHNMA